jgi:hypothetical protein
MIDTFTDFEIKQELAKRYEKVIVIHPNRKNPENISVFCKTDNDIDAPYTLIDATEMLQDAQKGLITDCFERLNSQ